MKKIIISVLTLLVLTACGSSKKELNALIGEHDGQVYVNKYQSNVKETDGDSEKYGVGPYANEIFFRFGVEDYSIVDLHFNGLRDGSILVNSKTDALNRSEFAYKTGKTHEDFRVIPNSTFFIANQDKYDSSTRIYGFTENGDFKFVNLSVALDMDKESYTFKELMSLFDEKREFIEDGSYNVDWNERMPRLDDLDFGESYDNIIEESIVFWD